MGTDASCRSNVGLGDCGYCRTAARARRAVVVDSNPSCSLAVAISVAEVAELARSSHCMEVGLGWLEDEEGSSALQRSSRLLPCLIYSVVMVE